MNGKKLAEFRMEIELGLKVYAPEGLCCVWRKHGKYICGSFYDASYTCGVAMMEGEWDSFEHMLFDLWDSGMEIDRWTTLDNFAGHPSIEAQDEYRKEWGIA